MERLGFTLNLKTNALTQRADMDFSSLMELQNELYAAGASGIYKAQTGEKVDANFSTGALKWGIPKKKRLWRVYIQGSTTGDLKLKVTVDGTKSETFDIISTKKDGTQTVMVANQGGSIQGNEFQFEIQNVKGCDFSIDEMEAIFIVPAVRV